MNTELLEREIAKTLADFDDVELDADMVSAIRALTEAIWTFEWAGREDAQVCIYNDEGVPRLRLDVWTQDSEDTVNKEETHVGPLAVSRDIEPWVDARQQIRNIIHWHLCHEVDEVLLFNGERPFYAVHRPHPTKPGVSLVDG